MQLDFKEYMIQGKALIGAGKFDAALDYFTKAEKEDPLNREVYLAQVYYSLGLFYEDDEKYDLALLNYSKAIKTDENRPDVRVKKARLLLSNHEGYTSRSIRGNLSTDEWCGRCT